jgi:hypothetical protein
LISCDAAEPAPISKGRATDRIEQVRSRKTIYAHFDLSDYSIPPSKPWADL